MSNRELAFTLVDAATSVTKRLDSALSSIKGISFSEYQLLAALKNHPGSTATRVDLASLVGLTPSGVTRALKPLEKIGFVATIKDGRDARKSLASLTPAGVELIEDADGVVNDTLDQLTALDSTTPKVRDQLLGLLVELAG